MIPRGLRALGTVVLVPPAIAFDVITGTWHGVHHFFWGGSR